MPSIGRPWRYGAERGLLLSLSRPKHSEVCVANEARHI